MRAATLARYEALPVDRVIGTIALDRIADIISFIIITIGIILWQHEVFLGFFDSYLQLEGLQSKLLILVAFIGFGVVLYLSRKWWGKFGFTRKIISFIEGIYEGVLSIRHMKNTGSIFTTYGVHLVLVFYDDGFCCEVFRTRRSSRL